MPSQHETLLYSCSAAVIDAALDDNVAQTAERHVKVNAVERHSKFTAIALIKGGRLRMVASLFSQQALQS